MSFGNRLLVILLLVTLTVGIIHVGKNKNILDEETKKQSFYLTETVNLWYYDDRYTEFFTNAVVAFHDENPDVRVIPTLVDSAEYLERINEASLGNEDYPDIYLLTNDSLEKAYLAGLASKTEDVSKVLNKNHFGDGALNAVKYRDAYVAYPLTFDTCVLLYNETFLSEWVQKLNAGEVNLDDFNDGGFEINGKKDLTTVTLDDFVPKSIDDIIAFSESYVATDGVESIIEWDVSDVFFDYLFLGKYMVVGGDSGDDTSNIDICNDNTIACATVYKSLSDVFSIDAESSSYEKTLDNFLNGKSVYTLVSSDAIAKVNEAVEKRAEELRIIREANALDGTYEEDDDSSEETSTDAEEESGEVDESIISTDNMKEYRYGYTLAPNVSEKLESRSLSVTDALVINGYSEKRTAANRFAAYVSTKYADQLYSRTGKLAASMDAGYTDPAFTTFVEEYNESIPLAKMVELSNLWVQLEITFQEIWDGADVTERLTEFANQISSQIISE